MTRPPTEQEIRDYCEQYAELIPVKVFLDRWWNSRLAHVTPEIRAKKIEQFVRRGVLPTRILTRQERELLLSSAEEHVDRA